MNVTRLLILNLVYHWRGNLGVFLGVTLGTAVLTGALLVGDSLKGSLRALALDQLGWVEEAMVANRFFRANLADHFSADRANRSGHSCAVVMLQGSATKAGDKTPRRVNKIAVLGVNDGFWPKDQVPVSQEFWHGAAKEVVLSASLAEALRVKAGDEIYLNVQKANAIPRELLLGNREDVVEAIAVKVRDILPERGMGRFTLRPSPEPVRNAFVPLRFLQDKLELTPKDGPEASRANVLLVAGAGSFDARLREHLTLADWNLKLRSPEDRAHGLMRFLEPKRDADNLKLNKWTWTDPTLPAEPPPPLEPRIPEELFNKVLPKKVLAAADVLEFYRRQRNYFVLESQQMLLEDAVEGAVYDAFAPPRKPGHIIKIGTENWWLVPTFIYLADSISDGKKEVPYAVIAAQGPRPQETDPPPLGNQIDLAQWRDAPFQAKPGDRLKVSFYLPDDHNHLQLRHEDFEVRKLLPLEGRFDDPDLVPVFPGISDKLSISDWQNQPFPFKKSRVKPADDNYWKRYRTTPRAYISLEKAQKLWGSRFGKLTSFHVAPMGEPKNYAASLKLFEKGLLERLNPAQSGFVFQKVREQGLRAGGGSTDFGVYFFYFSFFLIVAALLLVGLLFRLNLDRRSQEIGILLATGWTCPQVRRLLLGEGSILAMAGGITGLAGALAYADQLLKFLEQKWPGGLNFLKLHWTWETFAIGLAASSSVSVLTIIWATRVLTKMTPRALLAGETTASAQQLSRDDKVSWSKWVALVAFVGAIVLSIVGMISSGHVWQVVGFFGSGALLLTASLAAIWLGLRRGARHSNPRQSVAGLGVRNAGRHAVRSVLTVGLLASATFLIVAVEAFHKEPNHAFAEKTGGSGGFPLLAQADVPIFQDLNAAEVRKKLFAEDDGPLLDKVRLFPFRVRAGDDTSCLNLYNPQRPRVLGAPRTLIERGGFAFAASEAKSDAEKKNPWLLLEKDFSGEDGKQQTPVFVDATTDQWILKIGLGGTRKVKDDRGADVELRVVGLFDESIFQSEMVMAEANFRKLFSHEQGFAFFLVEGPRDQAEQIKSALEVALADNGLAVESTAQRLENYLAVENTYLSTFQALGGLGLLLGAVGLAIVLLRGVWERRGELALLRALGFRKQTLAHLVLAENVFLLLTGLTVGTLAAVVAVAPHLAGNEARLLWLRIAELLGFVVVVGLTAGLAAVLASLRAPLIQVLRRE